ncbi:uncharacterized protein [Notamacropus eugenii]|uniref:uncharacterized protein isoform X2 n=1 Tax=Notamacropus eugenii TaxID=9315 RepID=UPI003B66FB82
MAAKEEENLLRDEGFHETAKKDSLEREQISVNNEETSRTTDSGRYIRNKETSGQGIIIKSPLPTRHKVSPVSERELDVPFKDIKPSELATVEEENLEDILEPGIQEMGLNMQQGTWRNRKCHHPKSLKEQFYRNEIDFERPCEIQLMILPNFRELTTEPSCNYPSQSQSTSFGNPSSRSSSFHCLLL